MAPTLEQLLEAGVHFGHQTRRWNPKMRRFIFAERNGIHIIDLQKTLRQLDVAQQLVRDTILRGENVLFVCTKRQLAAIVQGEAERCGAMHVTERWLGGLLTNFQTIKKQTRRLKELEAGSEAGGEFENFTKKEQLLLTRQRDKLLKNLSGIKNMTRLPGLLFIIDAKKERIGVSEANKLGLPIVAICDTNSDPDLITVPIAGNDDAIRSVELITRMVADTILEARREAPARSVDEDAEESTYSSDRGLEPAAAGSEEERRKRRRPRRRRAKPEAIAARLKTGGEGGDGIEAVEAVEEGDVGDALDGGDVPEGADTGADARADTGADARADASADTGDDATS